jgi:hypothetical protein
MANYYTEFSVELDVLTKENVERVYKMWSEPANQDMEEICCGFDLKPDSSTKLWINSGDEGGDVDSLCSFIKLICSEILLTGIWGFEWANTCSGKRLDAFGGGAVLFNLKTGDQIDHVNTSQWLANAMYHANEFNEVTP